MSFQEVYVAVRRRKEGEMILLLWIVIAICVIRILRMVYGCLLARQNFGEIVNGEPRVVIFSALGFGLLSGAVIVAGHHCWAWLIIAGAATASLVVSSLGR